MSLFTVQTSEPQVAAAPVLDDAHPSGGMMTALVSLQHATMPASASPSALPSASTSPTENGTPFYHGPDDIPIDPALHGPPVDPPLLVPNIVTNSGVEIPVLPEPLQKISIPPHLQYFQGPQGDPFAPQPPPSFFPPELEPPIPSKPPKKKRKPRREPECGLCGGDDSKNKSGERERMVSCADCGRSGHPTCLKLADQAETIHSYEWQCTECKTCEVCHEKDGDNQFLLCDSCDRGWHMACLNPPLEQEPPGSWYCPACPPIMLPSPQLYADNPEFQPVAAPSVLPQGPIRESSVASSSRSTGPNSTANSRRKGKARATATDESEIDAEDAVGTTRSTRRRPLGKGKLVAERQLRSEIEPEVEEPAPLETPRPTKRLRVRLSSPVPPSPKPTKIRLRLPARKGKERADDLDDGKKGMFDDILPPEDRDVGPTSITQSDKARFERSRAVADEKLLPPPPPPDSHTEELPVAESSMRPLRSSLQKLTPAPSASPAPSTPLPGAHSENYLRIRYIRIGEFDIQTWFDAPFPEEYMTIPDGRLWICEFCLKYMKSKFNAYRHKLKCKMRHPPGDEIYRDGAVAIFEVDGRRNKIYCQNLCLLSKMFLDHKSLFYDVEPFLFYVITEVDDVGARFVGYFSKEKRSPKDYNVSCIMTLPVRQRQGWGNLLIDFSYLLSKKERRTGSPEKPLSALGALSYRNYWTLAIMRYLRTAPENPRLEDISAATSMTIEDIYSTLMHLNMIDVRDRVPTPRPLPGQAIKTVKGRKSNVARKNLQRPVSHDDEKVKGPFIPPRSYTIKWKPEDVEQYFANWEAKGYFRLRPENLKWSPFLIARTFKSDGLPAEDQLEAPTPTADVLVTPLTGPTSEHSHQQHNTASPALDLFDDDDVIEVSRRPSAEEEEHVRAESPSDDPDMQSTPARTRRQHSSSPVNVDITPRPKRPRRSTTGNVGAMSTGKKRSDRPGSRRTRSAVQVPSRPHDAALIAEDAALAARLAMEEDAPRRQLRSRSNTEQSPTRPLSPTTSRSISPRKRKRVESPPNTPSTRQTRSQALQATPPRPAPTRRQSSHRTPSKRRKPQRRPSRLAKEVLGGDEVASPEVELDLELEQEPDPEPGMDHHSQRAPSPTHHESGVTPYADAMPESEPGAAEDPDAMEVEEAVAPVDGGPVTEDDALYEDTETPHTGASRHSVGRTSDDTVVPTEEQPRIADKMASPVAVVELSVVAPEHASVDQPMATAVSGADDDPDIDAEGEEDAEGELDVDGEDDIDAEGEPDTGEDLELDLDGVY